MPTIQIYENATEFIVHMPYDKKLNGAIRQIAGRKWDGDHKVWRVPLGQRDKITELYNTAMITERIKAPARVGAIPPMPELTEELQLLREPFPFQNQGIAYIMEHHEHCLVGDQPGLGKTTQAIGAVMLRKRLPCLVICPSTLKANWQREFMIVAGKRALILSDRTRHTWHRYVEIGLVDVVICNFESLEKYFVSHIKRDPGKKGFMVKDVVFNEKVDMFQAIVVDESHRCKDMKVTWTKFTMGICLRKKMVLALSGTPVVNKTIDLAAQLFIIGRMAEFGGLEFFEKRYCDTKAYLKELQYKLRTTCFYQRKKSEVLKDLPDKIRQIMLCDITTRREYNAALADLENYLKIYRQKTDGEVERSMRGEIMVRIGVCKNISARGKLNEVFEWVDQLHASGEKAVLFIYQHQIKDKIKERYPDALLITGDQSLDERNRAEQAFQNDPRKMLIILSIECGSLGLTLTAASNVGMVEFPWHAAKRDQCEDRLHRITQKESVRCTSFVGKDTIDEEILEIIEEKSKLVGSITGNEDDTEKEIIDRVSNSLFNRKPVDTLFDSGQDF